MWKRSRVALALLLGCTMCTLLSATPAAAAVPVGYSVVVDESGVTTSGGLGGGGSLSASGVGNTNYGFARECAPSGDGGPFSIGHYPPWRCDQVGRTFSAAGSPEQPSGFWFTGNANCAGKPLSGSIFTWHVQLPQPGDWHIDVYIPNWTSYGFGNQYTMTSADGQLAHGSFTQQAYHGQWVNLFGSHRFAAGTDYTVELALVDQADSNCHYQMADEMRWVYDGGAPSTLPGLLARPTIAGAAKQGETLAESHGSWTNGPTSYRIQWEDCDPSGKGCVPIRDATKQAYTVGAGDVGHTIVVEETAVNSSGASAPAASAPTGVVAASPPVTGSDVVGGQPGGGGGGGRAANPARLKYAFAATARWTRFTALTVTRVPAGGAVRASCRGRGCTRKPLRVAGRRKVALKRFVGHRLRPHATIRIAVSAPGFRTRHFVLTVRAGRSPKVS